MANRLDKDGSIVVTSNPVHFVLAGTRSAAVGAAIAYGIHEWLELRLLAWSIGGVFFYQTIRAFVQVLFVPRLLTIRFGYGFVEGPKAWWYSRARLEDADIDWDVSGKYLGRVVIQDAAGKQLLVRLAWYHPEDRALILEQIATRRRNHAAVPAS